MDEKDDSPVKVQREVSSESEAAAEDVNQNTEDTQEQFLTNLKKSHRLHDMVGKSFKKRNILSAIKSNTQLQLMVPNSLKGLERLFTEKLKKAKQSTKETQTTIIQPENQQEAQE